MSFYEEDFYDEPSEFDLKVEEFKESLSKSVKEEFLSEMERLRKENAELQEVKANLKQIKAEYEEKKRELDREKFNLESKVRRERLSQLMKEFEVELYTVATTSKKAPKCDKCDEDRKIHYTKPSGKPGYETCECDERIYTYEPIETILSTFSIRNGEGHAWYKVKTDRPDEWLSYYEDSISGKDLISSEDQFENIRSSYQVLFKDKEIAQKYCDYKNKK